MLDTVRAEAAQTAEAPKQSFGDRARGWIPRPAVALAAVAAVAAALVIGLVIGSSGSPSTRVVNASVSGRPGTAELRVRGTNGDLILRGVAPAVRRPHLPDVGAEERGQERRPTPGRCSASDTPARSTSASRATLKGVKQVLVTQEPAGGSASATARPIAASAINS